MIRKVCKAKKLFFFPQLCNLIVSANLTTPAFHSLNHTAIYSAQGRHRVQRRFISLFELKMITVNHSFPILLPLSKAYTLY